VLPDHKENKAKEAQLNFNNDAASAFAAARFASFFALCEAPILGGFLRGLHSQGQRDAQSPLRMLNEHDKQNREQRVHAHESQQGKQTVAAGDVFGVALRGSNQPIDYPRLASHFRRHPPGGVGNVWKRKTEQQRPQNPAGLKQLPAPEQKCSDRHNEYEIRAQSGHDVVAVKQERQGFWPLIARKLVQALHFSFRGPIDQETQDVTYHDGIVAGLALLIGVGRCVLVALSPQGEPIIEFDRNHSDIYGAHLSLP
jgi:hypothetical protein